MRFIGLLKMALLEDTIDHLLLPTLVWSTRYHKRPHQQNTTTTTTNTTDTEEEDWNNANINPVPVFWPVPFDELFDVDHWNTFHQPNTDEHENEDDATSRISLPLLITSIDETLLEEGDDEGGDVTNKNPNTANATTNTTTTLTKMRCSFSKSSFQTAIENHTIYQSTTKDDRQALLPPLTYRMLLDETDTTTPSYFLAPLYEKVIDYLFVDGAKRFHRIDYRQMVEHCTHPIAYGSGTRLWNEYLQMEKRAPSIVPNSSIGSPSDVAVALERQQRRRLRRQRQNKNKKNVPKDDEQARWGTRLVKTIDEALIPAQPWRILANQCVQHHLMNNNNTNNNNKHADTHGYIALHARIEPEMLDHRCGKNMEQNLTTILNLVEQLSIDYNDRTILYNTAAAHTTPTTTTTQQTQTQKPRTLLQGVFVAVGRDEMQEFEKYSKTKEIAMYNWNVLNDRTSSYDEYGNQLFTSSYSKQNQRWTYQQHHEDTIIEEQEEHDQHNTNTIKHTNNSSSQYHHYHSLPIFECGEGWVEYGFYKDKQRQRELLAMPSSSPVSPPTDDDDDKDDNRARSSSSLLYQSTATKTKDKNNNNNDEDNFVPLPNNYYGDIVPSMINFWLAVNADVFVGVMKSSWSNDIWTTRYYQGKGAHNYEYTKEHGITPVGNNGLPPPHKNC